MDGSKDAVTELAGVGTLAKKMRRRKKNVGQKKLAASLM